MIERYTLPEMGRIWTDQRKYERWLEVEIAAAQAMAEAGQVPPEAVQEVRSKAHIDANRINEIEAITHHDVIAFLSAVSESVGESARFLHLGLTSSDVLDTAGALALVEAGKLLLSEIDALQYAVAQLASKHRMTPMIGRTHGIHAEPITLGMKLAVWYDEINRMRERLTRGIEIVRVGKISGAVGSFANVSPQIEARVCELLGLVPEPASTQVVQRDRHADFMCCLAVCAASLEKFAVEIRHLQKTEVRELEEGFAKGQKGSSAMPHKRNPIVCERVTGLARVLRANAMAALENVALWHERDISHSSVERVIFPDSTILLHYMLRKFTRVVNHLNVYPEAMQANLDKTRGLIHSQRVMLALTERGLSRDDAYAIVQRNAMRTWQGEDGFLNLLKADSDVLDLIPEDELEGMFDLTRHTQHTDEIFDRVGLSGRANADSSDGSTG